MALDNHPIPQVASWSMRRIHSAPRGVEGTCAYMGVEYTIIGPFFVGGAVDGVCHTAIIFVERNSETYQLGLPGKCTNRSVWEIYLERPICLDGSASGLFRPVRCWVSTGNFVAAGPHGLVIQ